MQAMIQIAAVAETVEDIDAQIAALQARRAELQGAKRRDVRERLTKHRKKVAESAKDVTVPVTRKVRTRFGQKYGGQDSGMMARIGKRDGVAFIHLTGSYNDKAVDITFKVGDTVEYDSYNLRYLGVIEKITDKRITVQPRYGARRKSMDLYSFAWRNYNFKLEEALEENAQTSMYI